MFKFYGIPVQPTYSHLPSLLHSKWHPKLLFSGILAKSAFLSDLSAFDSLIENDGGLIASVSIKNIILKFFLHFISHTSFDAIQHTTDNHENKNNSYFHF